MLCGIGKCTLEGDSSDIPQSNCLGHTSRRDFLEDKALQAEGSVVFLGGGRERHIDLRIPHTDARALIVAVYRLAERSR